MEHNEQSVIYCVGISVQMIITVCICYVYIYTIITIELLHFSTKKEDIISSDLFISKIQKMMVKDVK